MWAQSASSADGRSSCPIQTESDHVSRLDQSMRLVSRCKRGLIIKHLVSRQRVTANEREAAARMWLAAPRLQLGAVGGGVDAHERAALGRGRQQPPVLAQRQRGQRGRVRLDEARAPHVIQLHAHLSGAAPQLGVIELGIKFALGTGTPVSGGASAACGPHAHKRAGAAMRRLCTVSSCSPALQAW